MSVWGAFHTLIMMTSSEYEWVGPKFYYGPCYWLIHCVHVLGVGQGRGCRVLHTDFVSELNLDLEWCGRDGRTSHCQCLWGATLYLRARSSSGPQPLVFSSTAAPAVNQFCPHLDFREMPYDADPPLMRATPWLTPSLRLPCGSWGDATGCFQRPRLPSWIVEDWTAGRVTLTDSRREKRSTFSVFFLWTNSSKIWPLTVLRTAL